MKTVLRHSAYGFNFHGPTSAKALPAAVLIGALLAGPSSADEAYTHYLPVDGTYSIIAVDPETGQLGMGVQSKALSVGNRTITGKGGVAMVAHQSSSNPMYGTVILDVIERGMSPEQALEFAKRADLEPNRRQVAVIDIEGRSAAWTPPEITQWAGHRCAPTYCVQGNTLTGPEVIEAMAEAFEAASGPLADRMLAALDAGQAAGGDWRGMQGAALMVKLPLSRGGFDDRLIDIRVDDHREPLVELRRVYDVTRAAGMMGDVNDAMAAGDFDRAMELAVAVSEIAPTFDLPIIAMAEAHMRKGEMDAALDLFEQAIAINPGAKEIVLRAARFEPLHGLDRFKAIVAEQG
jgi:uncharacterized Ntn-hydrolase superfamily protein